MNSRIMSTTVTIKRTPEAVSQIALTINGAPVNPVTEVLKIVPMNPVEEFVPQFC